MRDASKRIMLHQFPFCIYYFPPLLPIHVLDASFFFHCMIIYKRQIPQNIFIATKGTVFLTSMRGQGK